MKKNYLYTIMATATLISFANLSADLNQYEGHSHHHSSSGRVGPTGARGPTGPAGGGGTGSTGPTGPALSSAFASFTATGANIPPGSVQPEFVTLVNSTELPPSSQGISLVSGGAFLNTTPGNYFVHYHLNVTSPTGTNSMSAFIMVGPNTIEDTTSTGQGATTFTLTGGRLFGFSGNEFVDIRVSTPPSNVGNEVITNGNLTIFKISP
jgi:hypothetical protein